MNRISKTVKSNYQLYIMIAIPLMVCVVFYYLPMYGLIIAFKKYDLVTGLSGTPWVGFKYFIEFFQDPYCFRLIRNTFLLGIMTLSFLFVIPIVFAILLNEVKCSPFKKIVQSVSYFPFLISVVIIIGIFFDLFSNQGLINNIVSSITGKNIDFLTNQVWFRPLYIFIEVWQKTGYYSIIYLAAISSINEELYEACYIDGANRWKRILHITIPGLLPTMVVLLLLNFGKIMDVSFEKVFLMYNPAIYETSDVISTYIYRRGIQGVNFSYAAAMGFINSTIALILLSLSNFTSKKLTKQSLW